MVGFVVGLFVAAGLYSSFGEYLSPHIGASPTVANILAFLVLWIVVPIVLGLVANLLTKALKGMKIGLPNSILGAAVSLIKYLILMSCVFNVMSFLGIVSQAKAEEAVSILSEVVTKTDGFKNNMTVQEYLLSDEEGNPLSDEQIQAMNISGNFKLQDKINLSVKLITKGKELHYGGGTQLAIRCLPLI